MSQRRLAEQVAANATDLLPLAQLAELEAYDCENCYAYAWGIPGEGFPPGWLNRHLANPEETLTPAALWRVVKADGLTPVRTIKDLEDLALPSALVSLFRAPDGEDFHFKVMSYEGEVSHKPGGSDQWPAEVLVAAGSGSKVAARELLTHVNPATGVQYDFVALFAR